MSFVCLTNLDNQLLSKNLVIGQGSIEITRVAKLKKKKKKGTEFKKKVKKICGSNTG